MKDDRIEPTIKPIDIDDSLFDDDDKPKKKKTEFADSSTDKSDAFDLDFADKSTPKSGASDDMTDIKLKFDEDDFDEKPMVAEARDDNPARKPAAEASVSQPSVLSPFGRLDRFRALIFVVAATIISYLLIIGLDPALAWLFNTIGVETTNKHGYQLDPIIYASLGVTFFMLAILLVTIKRLRDANFSPFFSILLFMFPIVIPALVPIFMCTLPGSKEDNRFGPAPRRWGIGTYLAAAIFLVGVPIALWSIKDNMLTYLFDLVPKAKETSS